MKSLTTNFYTFFLIVFTSTSIFASTIDSLQEKLSDTFEPHQRGELMLQLGKKFIAVDMDRAMDYTSDGIMLYEENKNDQLLGELYNLKGNIYLYKGQSYKAREAYFNAIQQFRKIKNKELEVRSQTNLCQIYQQEKNYSKALAEYEKAIATVKELSEDIQNELLPHLYLNKGTLYDELNEPEKAIHLFNQVIRMCKNESQLIMKSKALHNLSNQYANQKRFEDALEVLKASYEIKQKLNDERGEINSLVAFAHIASQQGQLKKAEKFYLKAIEQADEVNSPVDLKNVYYGLSTFFEANGHTQKAFQYFKEYKKASDELLQQRYSKGIADLEQNQIKALEKIQLLHEKEEQQTIIIILTCLFIGIIAIILMVLRVQRLKMINAKQNEEKANIARELETVEHQYTQEQNKVLQSQVEFKDKELTTNIMHLMQQNELINKVSEELLSIDSELDSNNKKKIRSIVYNLQNANQGEVWKELEYRFEQVHSDFFDKLHQKFPSLSPNEKKLCAFLKLNLSTKDISNITHQSVKSIQVARYRLRRKLEINNTDVDFQTFFDNISYNEK
ncbi:tetratricopeptide repeat protein [Flammeovirga aprica]|uniref:Tetratricopeptide repeat protein n=1 Tax=Flammeovirga aprica JL-4 TaxID=694437 RepID=A0A7X9XDE1_9BACT|nr:tetratricopeptide repeat protein [Flammeovirga aprica]NME72554.1 tetratricopeptide repeat protein [Flammeovirga aprica JL-4]